MLYRIIFFSIFMTILPEVFAQQQDDYVVWEEGNGLRWQHFKGAPDAGDQVHAAVTFAGIELKVEKVNLLGEITFKAQAVFDQQQSWSYPNRQTATILQHEQLHFDIAEVYARKLERKLNALRIRQGQKAAAKKLLDRYTRAQLACQARYDRETVHGLHPQQQQAWRELIRQELANPSSQLELQLSGETLTAGHG